MSGNNQTNSRGESVSEKFLREKEREREYLKAVQALLDGTPWTEEKAAKYRAILEEFGMLNGAKKKGSRH